MAEENVTTNVRGLMHNIISGKPQVWTAYLVGIKSHTRGCHSIILCGCPTHKGCEGAVDPPVGRCVITLCESKSCSSLFRQTRGLQRARLKANSAVGEECSVLTVYKVSLVETPTSLSPCHSTSFRGYFTQCRLLT